MTIRAFFFASTFAVTALAGCEKGEPCPASVSCTEGAECRCDGQGRLAFERRDLNGDKVIDRLRFIRDEQGRVTTELSDFSDNDSVDRRQEYRYDANGNRLGRKGWTARCDKTKFHWECTFETPCPAPYDKCSTCLNTYQIEQADGSFKPCGKH